MTFAAPLFLLAALAGLIPVFVHLIHRQKARMVHYSTLRFLRISVQRTRRRKYIEDMSLLAVRVAVLLLIAVGLARPALSSLATLWGGGRTAAIAIVLDNSASMAVVDGGRPRFETARQAAEQVLTRLREGDQVALLPTGGPPGPELGRLSRTHETVRQALDQCRPSYERADLAARLQQARDLLAQADGPQQGDLRPDRQPEPLLRRPERASPGRRSEAGETSRPRGHCQRGPRAGAQRGPADCLPLQPGPGRRCTISGCRRGAQLLDSAPAKAPGIADRRRPGSGQPRPQPAAGRNAQVRVPLHPGPGGRASGRGETGGGGWISTG